MSQTCVKFHDARTSGVSSALACIDNAEAGHVRNAKVMYGWLGYTFPDLKAMPDGDNNCEGELDCSVNMSSGLASDQTDVGNTRQTSGRASSSVLTFYRVTYQVPREATNEGCWAWLKAYSRWVSDKLKHGYLHPSHCGPSVDINPSPELIYTLLHVLAHYTYEFIDDTFSA